MSYGRVIAAVHESVFGSAPRRREASVEQPLCTLRVRRHRRLTQHSLPGGLLSLTWAGLAPADRASFLGAFLHAGYEAVPPRATAWPIPSGLASIRTNATRAGALPRFTQE